MPEHVEHSLRKPKIEAEANFSDLRESRGSSSSLKPPDISERAYVSPYPILSEGRPSGRSPRLKSILKVESEPSSSSNSSTPSSFFMDRDCYFEILPPTKAGSSDDASPGSDSSTAVVRHDFTGSPKAFGGVLTAVSSLNSLPIKSTIRNAELFQLCKSAFAQWACLLVNDADTSA
jgi:hypothetical protein